MLTCRDGILISHPFERLFPCRLSREPRTQNRELCRRKWRFHKKSIQNTTKKHFFCQNRQKKAFFREKSLQIKKKSVPLHSQHEGGPF